MDSTIKHDNEIGETMDKQWRELAQSIANRAQALADDDGTKYDAAQRYTMVCLLVDNIDTLEAWTPNPPRQ